MKKRVLSLFLVLAMCLTLLPTAALAGDENSTGNVAVQARGEPEPDPEQAAEQEPEQGAVQNDGGGSGEIVPLALEDETASGTGDATEENAAAVVNGTDYYSSFDAACAAAKDGDTIQLRQNTDNQSTDANRITVAKGQSLTIDLNGRELYRYITVEGTLTLKGEAGGTVMRDITVLGTLVMMDSVRTEAQTTLTLGSAEQGGTLDVRSDSAYIGSVVKVINKGNTALSHGQFTKFTIEQADTRILDLLAEGYAFSNSSGVWNANKTSKEFSDGYVVSIKTHKHYFSNENTYDCKCGYICNHTLDPDTGACRYCHTQFKKARIGSEFYDSLAAALTAAAAQDGCTVTLLCDTVVSPLTVDSGTFTIDLDGHTWETPQSAALTIKSGADLTVQNGTIKSTSTSQFGAAIKLDGGSLTVGKKLICRGTYGIYIGSNSNTTLADDTVLIGGVYFLSYGKAPADLLPAGTAFAECSLNADGTVNIGEGFVTDAYKTGSTHADMAVVPHTHDFDTGTCVCGLTAAAEVNGKIYQTLAAAIGAANGDTVKLLAGEAGSGENITVAAGSTVTIDLNGKTLAAPITVLGTLRLDQSNSNEYGKANDLIVGNADAASALELLSDHIRIIKLTANQTAGIELDKGYFHEVRCPEGETLLSVLKEGYAFKGRTWNQNGFAYQASGLYAEVVECDHPSTIYSGAPVSAFENYHCKYCNYACPHDKGFHYDYDKGLVCSICGYSAAAYVEIGSAIGDVTGESFASLNDAVDFANQNAASTDKLITLRLHSSLNGSFTTTGKWTLDFKSYSLASSTITIGSDTTPGDLTLRNDYGEVAAGTVTVTSGSHLRTTKLEIGDGKLIFPSLTVQKGASASLSIGNFWSITNEGGKLADLLPSSFYAFELASSGTVINAYERTSADNVAIVRHTHTMDPETNTCACGFHCEHSEGYLNGVCKTCGAHCPHPLDQIDTENNECNICRASLLATMTPEGGTTAYFSDLAYAFRCAPENGSATVTLLQDAELFGVNTDPYYGTLGKILIGNAEAVNGRTVTLDMNGHVLSSDNDVIDVGSEDTNETPSKLTLTGKQGSSISAYIEVLPTGTLVTDGWNGRIDHLLIKNGKVQLSGGTFGKIGNTGDTVKLGDLLAEGYAFQDLAGTPILRSGGIAANGAMGNIAVARCVKHAANSANDPCLYCGATGFAAQTVADGETTYYTDLPAAIAEANKTSGKIAITLLKDVTDLDQALTLGGASNWKDNDITLDLNGKTLSGTGGESSTFLAADTYGTVTICDSGATGLIKNTKPGGNYAVYVSTGKLTINGGKFEGTDNNTLGIKGYALGTGATLNITGGTFNSQVYIDTRYTTTISGGTFASLQTFDGSGWGSAPAISTLLKPGYTFKTTGGDWLTDAALEKTAATNVTAMEEPIRSVTLTANDKALTRNEHGWYTLSVEYGQPVELKVTAQGAATTKYLTWYPVALNDDGEPESTGNRLNNNDNATLTLSADALTIGNHAYAVIVSDARTGNGTGNEPVGYQKTASIIITVTKVDISKLPAEEIDLELAYCGNFPYNINGTPNAAGVHATTMTLGRFEVNGTELTTSDYTLEGNVQYGVGDYTLTITVNTDIYTGSITRTWHVIPHKLGLAIFPQGMFTKVYDGTTALPKNASYFDGYFGEVSTNYVPNTTKLNASDYELVKEAFENAVVGNDKRISFTIKLKNENYEFDTSEAAKWAQEGITITADTMTYTNCIVHHSAHFNITPADVDMTDAEKTVTLDVINDLAYTYTVDLPELPELTSPKTYGDINYLLPDVHLTTPGYYTVGKGNAKVENGKLILTIDKNNVATTGSIGTVAVTVSSTNYNDVTLTVNLNAVNKPMPDVTVTAEPSTVTYGTTLKDITPVFTAICDGRPVEGTVRWALPDRYMPNVHAKYLDWIFTPTDQNAYLSAGGVASITVKPATLTGQPTFEKITQSGKMLADAALTANEGWPEGTLQWVDKDGKVLDAAATEVKANTAYQWRFTPNSDNYDPLGGSITLYSVSTGGSGSTTHPVNTPNKTENGTVTVSPKNASKGSTVTITAKPDGGYRLDDLTVTDKDGNKLKLTDKGGGKYSFVMPDGKVSVEASFVKAAPTSFVDVPANAYFAGAVEWAVENGVTNGLTDTMFGPYESCTRAQIVTFLWRAAGSPEPKAMSSFTDVPASAYYAKAVAWAVENGITNGMTETTFAPDATCTRGQSVTFLYRALKGAASGSANFTDVPANAFYTDAVNWAVANNVTNGTSVTTFSPNESCTRAEIVTFLYRAYQGK